MHGLAPTSLRGATNRYRIATFNPGSNRNEVGERARFMGSNTYTDAFVERCTGELTIDISNERILSADRNEVTALEAGTTRVDLAYSWSVFAWPS